MTIQRMDHVSIVVDDLAAATAFFPRQEASGRVMACLTYSPV